MAARLGPDRSWNIAWSGGLASLLLAALTGVLVSGRSGALAIADERQRRYDVVADSAPVLIWTSGTDTLYDSFNAPWLAFTGRTLAQELGNGWKEGVHPDDLKRCVDSYLAAFHARKPFSMEYRLRHADGAWRWIVDNGVARYLPNGTFVGYIGSCFDITERKHLRDELQRAVRQQEILLDTANVGIVMIVERRQLAVNRGMEELFGYTRAEMLGQTTRMYYPTQEAFDAFGRAAYPEVAKGLTFETEVELRRKDGSTLWVLYNGRAVDPHDPSKGSMWVLTDCTAERQAEEMLRESEARFRDLFESNSAVMLLVDPIDRAIVDANPAAATFYRYERAALQAMSIGQLNALPDEQLTDLLAHASAAHTTRFVVPHRLADGQLRTVEVNSSPTDFGGRRLLFSIIQDVTAREESHAALVRERERYRSLMDISQDGIHVLDLHGTLIDANPAFLRMLARKPDAIESLNVRDWDAAIPEADIEARVRALIERPDLFETRHRRADGTVFDVEVHAGGVELDGRSYLLAASRDITSRIELEHQLASNQVHLKELNSSLAERVEQTVAELRAKDQLLITQSRQAAMGEMVGNIAHQWRQPLNALALVLADLRDTSRLGELDGPTLDKAVADGNRLIQKMSSTINDFRDFLQPEKEKHFFSAVAQIRETMELLAPSFDHAGVVLTIDAPVDFRLFGFTNEYAQVLMNLLANAKEAIVGSGVAHGRVTVSLVEQDGHGYLTVLDNGGGIPVANLDRIFEPYFSTKDGGTGIGLYMSRQIVERSLGGRLEVRNVEGGAEFVVITPIADTTH